jgi:4-hydroxybenzoate polyprenyltransferase
VWVAGFDIIYALMDRDVDVAQQIRSFPARFGAAPAHRLPLVLHGTMLFLLTLVGVLAHAHALYYLGILLTAALIGYEGRLLRRSADVFALNERVFNANMLFSTAFLATTVAGFARL